MHARGSFLVACVAVFCRAAGRASAPVLTDAAPAIPDRPGAFPPSESDREAPGWICASGRARLTPSTTTSQAGALPRCETYPLPVFRFGARRECDEIRVDRGGTAAGRALPDRSDANSGNRGTRGALPARTPTPTGPSGPSAPAHPTFLMLSGNLLASLLFSLAVALGAMVFIRARHLRASAFDCPRAGRTRKWSGRAGAPPRPPRREVGGSPLPAAAPAGDGGAGRGGGHSDADAEHTQVPRATVPRAAEEPLAPPGRFGHSDADAEHAQVPCAQVLRAQVPRAPPGRCGHSDADAEHTQVPRATVPRAPPSTIPPDGRWGFVGAKNGGLARPAECQGSHDAKKAGRVHSFSNMVTPRDTTLRATTTATRNTNHRATGRAARTRRGGGAFAFGVAATLALLRAPSLARAAEPAPLNDLTFKAATCKLLHSLTPTSAPKPHPPTLPTLPACCSMNLPHDALSYTRALEVIGPSRAHSLARSAPSLTPSAPPLVCRATPLHTLRSQGTGSKTLCWRRTRGATSVTGM